MPMTRRVAALYLIAFLIGAGLFAANFFTERSFLLPLVMAIVMTVAHLGVSAWWIAQKPHRAAGDHRRCACSPRRRFMGYVGSRRVGGISSAGLPPNHQHCRATCLRA